MVLGRDLIAAPPIVTVRFEVNPVLMFTNILIIAHYEQAWLDGTDHTIHTIVNALPEERRQIHKLVYGSLCDAIPYVGEMSFPDFLADFAARDAVTLRNNILMWLKNKEDFPGVEALLSNEDAFIDFMGKVAEEHKKEREDDYMRLTYAYLADPARMKAMMLEHMTFMWDNFLSREWAKHESSIRQCVEAYRQKNYDTFKSAYDAVEVITGRDMRTNEKMKSVLEARSQFAFIPSPYLGPYLSWHEESWTNDKDAAILFGVRTPQSGKKSVLSTNRSELLIWMTALADDTRLQMLDMLLEEGEICAQDFIDRLQLSQSSASRHLRQLVTAGFLTSRRQDVAKCYTLNQERMSELVEILQHFTQKPS